MVQKAKPVSSRHCLEDSERVSDVPSKVHGTEGQEMSTGMLALSGLWVDSRQSRPDSRALANGQLH